MIVEKINKEEITEDVLSNIVNSLNDIVNNLKISEDIHFFSIKN